MCNNTMNWGDVKDLSSAIKRLQVELRATQYDKIYDSKICFDVGIAEASKREAKELQVAINLCDLYLSNHITLDQFCDGMKNNNLLHYMWQLAEFMPESLLEKYGLLEEEIFYDYDDEE